MAHTPSAWRSHSSTTATIDRLVALCGFRLPSLANLPGKCPDFPLQQHLAKVAQADLLAGLEAQSSTAKQHQHALLLQAQIGVWLPCKFVKGAPNSWPKLDQPGRHLAIEPP